MQREHGQVPCTVESEDLVLGLPVPAVLSWVLAQIPGLYNQLPLHLLLVGFICHKPALTKTEATWKSVHGIPGGGSRAHSRLYVRYDLELVLVIVYTCIRKVERTPTYKQWLSLGEGAV